MPAVDETLISKKVQTHLGGTDAVEEELPDLECVEVTVVMENLEDGDIPLGEGAEELRRFLLGEERAGVFAKITKNDGMTMYGSPSRGEERRFLNSQRLRGGVRSLKRMRKRRPWGESGSEVAAFSCTVLAAGPMTVVLVAFKNIGDVLIQSVEVVVARGHGSRSRLLSFARPISLKSQPSVDFSSCHPYRTGSSARLLTFTPKRAARTDVPYSYL